MALLQSTTISGSNASTGSLSITGSTMVFPIIESSLTGSFSGSGKMWVNADGNTLQYSVNTTLGTIQSPASFMGAWSAGGNMIKGRATKAGAGTQNAALAAGGYDAPATLTCVEEYDGTSWSAQNALITSRHRFGGAGLQNAAVVAGGVGCNQTEEYDGSSWSAGGNLITIQYSQAFAGVQQAAISAFGGTPGVATTSQIYNGSSWATTSSGNTARNDTSGMGTANAALAMGGNTGGAVSACSELWNGTTWSTWVPILTARSYLSATGTTNAGLNFFGGNPSTVPNMKCVEEWNGISFIQGCTAIQDRKGRMGAGSQSAALAAGGYDGSDGSPLTEEYTKDFIAPYTTCVWTSGASNITAKSGGKGAGDANAALTFGGNITPTRTALTEEYNGTNWSAGGSMINAVGNFGGTGTANAALAAGGEPATCCKAEEYNGSTWASGGNLSQGGYGNATLGTQNDALNFGGNFTGKKAETYDGSSWTTISDMNCCRRAAGGGAGTTSAAIAFGGRCYTAPTTCQLTLSEEWNGSSWSFGGSYTTPVSDGVAGGETVGTALAAGGYNPTSPAGTFVTELYDGTSWSAGANALEVIKQGAGSSIGASAFCSTGNPQNQRAQFYNAVCTTTLCSSLPVWSGTTQMLAASGYGAGFGTQNAAVVATGTDGSAINTSEEWDGTTWTAGNATQCAASFGRSGAGTLNAGLLFGGWPAQTWTEEYDGTNYSTANAMINSAYGRGSSGTQNAALAVGDGPAGPATGLVEEYDGTNWGTGGALSVARYASLVAGTQNDSVAAGGQCSPSGQADATEEYNGSSWSTGGALNINRKDEAGFQMFGEGAYNAVYAGGRQSSAFCTNEEYNGSAWSIRPSLPFAINSTTRIGTSTAGLLAGGRTPSYIANVFEYNDVVNTCVGTWSAGPNTSVTGTRETHFGGVGTQNAAALFSGRISPANITCTEEYNGSSWSAGGANITGRYIGSTAGTQNAGLLIGGNTAGACVSCTEEYDGSSWASGTANSRGVDFLTSIGTQNAAVSFGGRASTPSAANFKCTQFYDGTSWTAKNSLSTGRYGSGGVGTQNAALAVGGYCNNNGPGYQTGCPQTEEWDGTNWSTKQNLLFAVGAGNTAGTVNDSLMIGGYLHPAARSYNQSWDGTAWSMTQNLLAKAARFSSGGSSNAAIAAKGYTGMGTALWNVNQLGAGSQNWIGKVNFVTE